MEENLLAYLIWLVDLFSPSDPHINRLLDRFGSPEKIYYATERELKEAELTENECEKLLSARSLGVAEEVMAACEKNEIQILSRYDEDYPAALFTMQDPPALLFYKGNPVWKDASLSIAMIGTRRITQYGSRAASRFARELAEAGVLILGGLAEGVDTVAHTSAVECGGKTVAVLPCGVDVIYPKSNYNLYWDIVENGCIISEFFPGTRPLGANFQLRGRLLAGLSDGVLHIQSPEKSGSLITVKWAVENNRDVFALPGDVDVEQSEGPNQLIQSGAKLVTCTADILSEYGYVYAEDPAPSAPVESASEWDESSVAGKIIFALKNGDLDMTGLSLKTGLTLPEIILVLTDLQIKGIITEKPGGFYALSKTTTL